jgi:hypothetical protein
MSQEKVKAFAEGYIQGITNERQFYDTTLASFDDWVIWDEYDINFVGKEYTSEELGDFDALAVVYPKGWKDALPDHLFSFIIKGESK